MNNKKYLFVGARLGVLETMLSLNLNTQILILEDTFASQKLTRQNIKFRSFNSKNELLEIIKNIDFDILVSNGCPYILPISNLKKDGQIFINIHPSLLPNLKGNHPINGALLFNQTAGASVHIMDDGIDSGDVISQVKIPLNDLNLKLLYQLSFIAESMAFKKAYENKFIPIFKQKNSGNNIYYSRKSDDLRLDFTRQSNKEIISAVKAFSIKGQFARLECGDTLVKISEARIIKNDFLSNVFSDKENQVLMTYEDCCLIKKDGEFLELTCIENNSELLKNFSFKSYSFIPLSAYHSKEYTKLNLLNNDKIFEFSYEKDGAKFYNIAVKSKIPNTPYFDMSSPYGFAGYVCNTGDIEFLTQAINIQKEEALKQNIIAEFIRFHPDCLWINEFKNLLNFFLKANENIAVFCDPSRYEFYSSRLKSKINKAKREIAVKQSLDIDKFITLYYETMKRNGASDFYFFSKDYFERLLNLNNAVMFEASVKAETISMAIFLYDKSNLYYHLGANSTEFMKQNNNAIYAIFEHCFNWGANHKIQTCYLGGGIKIGDSLFDFKKQFASKIVPFYVGGIIYNKNVFDTLKQDNPHFLSYRFKNMGGGNSRLIVKLLPYKEVA
ncbi:Methionyl-tRNA formyltransferase [Campylobacter hyointestinalis subsp. hyointestinalis]|uniref:Methionyl-tRNA formyltransferase n=1 Tax=Campylobacter hyointestinalis subsp. hyointestinalis TaxID=91352 RepID=A0A0S4S0M5_CAMHY|nr:formyltransferase family protein [Campylobacter hyointestinalis]CUU79800.1 Methionyl-tRNA formyltransferase [Campylobacter hyointestinalis subsp. hyointestinalis]